MSGENIEVWDDDFLEELNQVEQLALSSSSSCLVSQPPIPNPMISYSPPRYLSQRTAPTDDAKDLEIQRLKRELRFVSKRLSEMEHECLELKEDKNEKEKLLKLASSKNDPEVANIQNSKSENLENGVPAVGHHEVFQQVQNANDSDQVGPKIDTASSSCKAIGIQVNLTSHFDLLEKLRAIWGSPAEQELGKAMIYKLFVECSREFHVLFGCMSMNTSVKMTDSLTVKSSVGALQYHTDADPSSEAEKISHLYSMLTKISNGMMQLEALLEPLLGLCHVDSVVVVSNSLRVLQVFLKHLLSWKNKVGESALYSGTMSWSREFFLGTTSEIMDPVLQKIDCFM